jgi:hypothetical protein
MLAMILPYLFFLSVHFSAFVGFPVLIMTERDSVAHPLPFPLPFTPSLTVRSLRPAIA